MSTNETQFPRLETERLVLKKLTPEYLIPVFRHFADDEVNKYSDSSSAEKPENAASIIRWGLDIFQKKAGILWGIFSKNDDTFLGEVNYITRVDSNGTMHRVEIGYDLSVRYWGKGYMTETLNKVIPYIFNKSEINRIEAVIHPDNIRSRKVVERQGFVEEALLREYATKDGKYWDMIMYSLLKRERHG